MKELILCVLLIWIISLGVDNIKVKKEIKVLQDSIVVIQKDLEFKSKIIKDYQSRL